ncbi:hypothetical protein P1X15_03225 [Runella sp. MFBS21]|uniref:hypothetical protein n=1 Tax=Runella sp. MFBS21 TaxID=3034018 RepID=UPI0023F8DE75|nr:hypothetical protein [Runella sp. MFBS21]MDF7816585.1 hypothetical protein [Runella sp. MFBS21]
MKAPHLSDEEIQTYALRLDTVSEEIHTHIQECELCRQKAQAYQLLFTTLEKPVAPVFDFDLAAEVIQQLPPTETITSDSRFTSYSVGGGVLVGIGMLFFYFFNYPIYLFEGLSSITLSILLTATVGISLFLGYDLYAKYQKQLKVLNLS